jgi:hypothetical protein
MNKLARLLTTTLLLGCASNPAGANDAQTMVLPQPWYYGLGIGLALPAYNKDNIANDFAGATNTSSFSNDDFTFKLYGGYRFDRFLAVEFGISELGTTIATTSGSSSKLFNTYNSFVNATMRRKYNNSATLFGKIGAHFWSIGPNTTSKLANGTDLSLGAGLEFNLSDNSSRKMRIEWDRYLFDNIYIDTIDTLTVNLVFKI